MGKLYSIISALLIALWSPAAFGQTGYEWWLDNDLGGRRSGTFSGDRLDLQVDMSGTPEGLHGFNCRINRADGTWGSIYRQTVLVPTSRTKSTAQAYEYWIDDNHASKVSGSLSAGANAYTVDLQGLKEGLHWLNYRVRTQYDEWSSIYCQYFLIPEANPKTNAKAQSFEYWIDDDYASKVSGNLSAGANAYTIDLQGFEQGLHRLNYRVCTQYGDWSSISCHYFYNVIESNEPRVVSYEYWLDNDRANRKTGTLDANQITLPIDISGLDKTSDFHLFNMRVGDNVKGWGSIYQKILVFNDHKGDRNIIGYRHRVNGVDLGFIEVNGGLTDSQAFMVDLPADMKFNTSYSDRPTFNGDVVSVEGSDSIHYSIQAKSKMGWSAPRIWDFAMSRDFSTTAVGMTVNSSHDFDAPLSGPFAAVKFTATGMPLYFRANVPVALDLYRNGEKVREFAAEEIAGMAYAELEAGEYFGLLHDVAESEATRFTFQLMDTPNRVPAPVIAFEEGIVSITCTSEGAEIHYTVDDENLTAESPLYTEPFALDRNATVRAFALIPGLDIEPSDVVNYEVDSYKVETPYGNFDAETRLLTLTCATEGAVISYAFDPEGEWISYDGPISITRNRTVYAKAARDGWNDSDVTAVSITELADNVPTPEISFEEGIVTISCANADAEIHYTIDDPDITAESPLYTEPFRLDRNATVRAFALIPDLDIEPSDIVTRVIDSFKAATPTGSFDPESRTLTLTCATDGATVSYTFDQEGEWTPYTDPIAITRNRTVYAKASRDGWNDSDVAQIRVTELADNVPAPEIRFEEGMVEISCANADAEIHYTVDDPDLTAESPIYTEPFALDRNATVRAFALIPGLDIEPSDVAIYVVDFYSTGGVRISYNGRYVSMAADDPDATILYSTDGSEPYEEYTGEFDAEGLRTVRAMAVRTGYADSEIAELTITRYADEEHAETAAEGLLASAFDWDETDLPNNVEAFRIQGRLNEADYAFIRSMGTLRHLDIEAVAEAHIPNYAFANTGLISVSLPEDMAECGDSILAGTSRLSSVVWNSRTTDVREGLTRSLASNPNILLYVPEGVGVENPGALHVVRDGQIASLTLSYGHPYYAARDFTADRVSMTREFLQPTEIGVCQGWETIVLPFSPTEITHEVNGPAAPFGSYAGGVDARRFWLYRANAGGWTAATSIEACVPYVISMPNSPDYVKEFNLGGKITFSAKDVALGPEGSLPDSYPWMSGTRFEGTFMPVDVAGILSLNVGSTEGDYRPGSTFVPDGTTLPFGAYVSGAGRKAMPLFGDSNGVDLPIVGDDGLLVETPAPGVLRISSGRERKVTVTTITGVTVRTLHLKPGEAQTLEGLTRDLYIVAGRKVMVR